MFCGRTCDELYHFTFNIDRLGIPLGSQPIRFTLARHSGVQVPVISRHRVTWSFLDQSQSSLRNFGTFQFLPTGLYGLCFGFCFAGPLPLRSLTHGPLLRVHFGESLVFRLYSEIDHIHLSSEAQCVNLRWPHKPPGKKKKKQLSGNFGTCM